MLEMIDKIFDLISHWLNLLFLSRDFKAHEQLVFDAWRNTLSEKNKEILDAQFKLVEFIQRGRGGRRVVCIYPKKESIPLFCSEQDLKNIHVASVVINTVKNGRKSFTGKVWVYKGIFFHIDFTEVLEVFMKENECQENDLRVMDVAINLSL